MTIQRLSEQTPDSGWLPVKGSSRLQVQVAPGARYVVEASLAEATPELEADMKPFRAVEETGSGGLYDVSAYARVRVRLVGGPAVLLVLKELA